IGRGLQHDWRHGADKYQFGDTALAVERDIVRCLAAARRMANVDGVTQIQVRDDRSRVPAVVVHVMAVAHLGGPAMAAPVMSNDSIPLPEEVEHLGVPVIGAQWPAMMEDDGWRVLGAPVLVEDRYPILRGNRAHSNLLSSGAQAPMSGIRAQLPALAARGESGRKIIATGERERT